MRRFEVSKILTSEEKDKYFDTKGTGLLKGLNYTSVKPITRKYSNAQLQTRAEIKEIEIIEKLSIERQIDSPVIFDAGTGSGNFIFKADKQLNNKVRFIGVNIQQDTSGSIVKPNTGHKNNIVFDVVSQDITSSEERILDFAATKYHSPPDFIVSNNVLQGLCNDYDDFGRYLETWLSAASHGVLVSVPLDENTPDALNASKQGMHFSESNLRSFALQLQTKRPDIEVNLSQIDNGLLVVVNEEAQSLIGKINKAARSEITIPQNTLQCYIKNIIRNGSQNPDVQSSNVVA